MMKKFFKVSVLSFAAFITVTLGLLGCLKTRAEVEAEHEAKERVAAQ